MTDEDLITHLRLHAEREAAADRIEALVERLTAAEQDAHEAEALANEALARAERLEAAASAVADDVCSYICPSVGKAGSPIPHDPRCIALRAALEGGAA